MSCWRWSTDRRGLLGLSGGWPPLYFSFLFAPYLIYSCFSNLFFEGQTFTQANAWWAHVLVQVVLTAGAKPNDNSIYCNDQPRGVCHQEGLRLGQLVCFLWCFSQVRGFQCVKSVLDITSFPSEPFFLCWLVTLSSNRSQWSVLIWWGACSSSEESLLSMLSQLQTE